MLDKFFEITKKGSTVKTEILAGITTFLTASYIIFVNPSILSEAGMDKNALITVTCLSSFFATLLYALWPRVPMMMAPGMGLNAFFAYTLVIGNKVNWQTGLGIVFISGILCLIMSLAGLREKILKSIPPILRLSTSIGIGLFITFIGLQNLGIIVSSESTLVKLGTITLPALLGLLGLVFITLLEHRKVKGSILYGIIFATVLGIILSLKTGENYVSLPEKIMSTPPSIAPLFWKFDLISAFNFSFIGVIFAFMYVDFFDTLGTLLAVSGRAGLVNKDGSIPKIGPMLMTDSLGTITGAIFGTSPTTTYIESASGIAQGGRTGLTALVVALLFLIAPVFAPLISIVPKFATAPALIIVGVFMMREIKEIDFEDFSTAIPAFLTIVMMPLTYSIANGIMFGFISYPLIKLVLGKWRELNIILVSISILSLINLLISF
jgi:adenine/guanine/hypoxanthine permease